LSSNANECKPLRGGPVSSQHTGGSGGTGGSGLPFEGEVTRRARTARGGTPANAREGTPGGGAWPAAAAASAAADEADAAEEAAEAEADAEANAVAEAEAEDEEEAEAAPASIPVSVAVSPAVASASPPVPAPAPALPPASPRGVKRERSPDAPTSTAAAGPARIPMPEPELKKPR
jgi:hypothetical protein